jgi:hypothetical protein
MINWTTQIYLYFLAKNGGAEGKFQDLLFNFHRLVSINNLLYWDRIFIFDDQKVEDNFFDKTITLLLFHGYIDQDFLITEKGDTFLQAELNKDTEFTRALSFFEEHYKGEYAIEKGCFVSIERFPTACHLCTNKICEKKQTLLQCVGSFVKPIKNPYRSYSKTS